MHRNLTPENIFLDKKHLISNIKISDFGYSKVLSQDNFDNKLCSSIIYTAPEVIEERYDEKCDIWSCGVIMYIMLSGSLPFYGDTTEELQKEILKAEVSFQGNLFIKIYSIDE